MEEVGGMQKRRVDQGGREKKRKKTLNRQETIKLALHWKIQQATKYTEEEEIVSVLNDQLHIPSRHKGAPLTRVTRWATQGK